MPLGIIGCNSRPSYTTAIWCLGIEGGPWSALPLRYSESHNPLIRSMTRFPSQSSLAGHPLRRMRQPAIARDGVFFSNGRKGILRRGIKTGSFCGKYSIFFIAVLMPINFIDWLNLVQHQKMKSIYIAHQEKVLPPKVTHFRMIGNYPCRNIFREVARFKRRAMTNLIFVWNEGHPWILRSIGCIDTAENERIRTQVGQLLKIFVNSTLAYK